MMALLALVILAFASPGVSQTAQFPTESRSAGTPETWIASLRIMGLFRTDEHGDPLVADWGFVSENIEGIKFWDGQIAAKSVEELRGIFAECRRRGLRIAYEKGRWPLPHDLHERALEKRLEKERSLGARSPGPDPDEAERRRRAERHAFADRGRPLDSYDPDEWAQKAAAPEIARLEKIQAAGGIDLLRFIDLDGAVLKNVFPYTFAMTQWRFDGIAEDKRYERGFADPAAFFVAFRRMVEMIRARVPAASGVMFRHLANVHFWTYDEPVVPERLEDGTMVYHNVDFHRFAEHTLDLAQVVPFVAAGRDVFAGVTTDYPYELFRRPAGNARYRALADDVMCAGLSFCPILTAMSANESMTEWSADVLAYTDAVLRQVAPDMLMVQSWGEHPTWAEFLKGEDAPDGFLGVVRRVVEKVRESAPAAEDAQ